MARSRRGGHGGGDGGGSDDDNDHDGVRERAAESSALHTGQSKRLTSDRFASLAYILFNNFFAVFVYLAFSPTLSPPSPIAHLYISTHNP